MFRETKAYSGFSVNDLSAARAFYEETLGVDVHEGPPGLRLRIAGRSDIVVYSKDDHVPATYTILNFPVDDIDRAVDELTRKGVKFEQYGDMTDSKGIARGIDAGRGPDIAWFKDPAGNILSVLKEG